MELSQFKGKKMIVVNVASACGYTPQYQQLQELHEHFGEHLAILGFPCNDFGGQEPGSAEEIQNFCSTKYRVTFPLTAKVGIRQRPHPVYEWLQQKPLNGKMDSEVKWNFHKFLLDEEGQLVDALPSAVSPLDDRILNWINKV